MICAQAAGRVARATFLFCLFGLLSEAQVSVLTQHNDAARDGLNANETLLTLSSVNTGNFGKLFSFPVDGYVFAQPLYVSNVAIPGSGTHNVVYVATMHDSVYAYDADGLTLQPLWSLSLAAAGCPSGWTCSSVPTSADYVSSTDIIPEVGVLSTPVIDPTTNTLYVVAKTQEISGSTKNYLYRLHALDVTTGVERIGSPVVIQGQVPGNGNPNSGGFLVFSPRYSLQRPGLALVNNGVYMAFGAAGDDDNWHGWIFGYDKTSLTQLAAFSTTPNGSEGHGGVWMAGAGLAVDTSGYLYFSTGNGAFDGATNFGDSILKLTSPSLTVSDYFTPFNQQILDNTDLDVASGSITLLPDSAGTTQHPHIAIACGKNSALYVLDRDNLGQFNSAGDTQIIQEQLNLVGGTHTSNTSTTYVENCYGSGAYWQGNMYYGGVKDAVKMFAFSNGLLASSPASQSAAAYQYPGATPSISANGTTNGIVWTIENSGTPNPLDSTGTSAILHAYNATNLSDELYNSTQVSSDAAGAPVKFAVPTIANGKVYVGTQASLAVYGLFSSLPQAAAPSFSPPGGTYSIPVSVTIDEATQGVTVYYTTDGSIPTTSSTVYTGPIVVSGVVTLNALAVGGGYRVSPVTTANYITGTGTGSSIVFVQGNYATPQTPQSKVTVPFPQAQLAGDLNLVVVGWNDTTATIPSGNVTDSKGNVYTLVVGPTQVAGTGTQAIYYAKNIGAAAAGANAVTVQFSTAAAYPDVRILEYLGADPNNPVDTGSSASGNSVITSVAIATQTANELIVAGNYILQTTTAAGSGFTSRMITVPDSDIVEDGSAQTPGTYTASATTNQAGGWIMQALALKPATTTTNPPTVSSVSPSSGASAGGTPVTITGTNFVAPATVTFAGNAATNIVVVSSTSITATTPAGSAGAVNVTVTANGQSGGLSNGFTYVSAPTVSSVSPNVGPLAGGTAVTITGANFASPATVMFGSTAATTVTVVSGTSITATTPAGSAGAVNVTVTANGQSGTLNNGYTYASAPTVSSVSPNVGPLAGGTAVTITGANFASPATVMFGSTAATNVTVVSGTSITATTPGGAAGAVTVTVTSNSQGGSLNNGFTYAAAPTVTNVSPNTGPLAGGTSVTITGTNFAAPATVAFGSNAATNVAVLNSTSITATTPAGVAGSVNVAVTSNGQNGTLNSAFTYSSGPTVSSVSPNAGPLAGGTTATITGANFASPATVMFGSAAATNVTVVSSTSISAVTPAGSAGIVSVAVTSNGQTGTLNNAFTYAAAPIVISVSPSVGSTTGGTTVTLTGANFASPATVKFGSAAATNVTVVSSTSITAITPAGAAGPVNITVTSNNQSGTLNNGFTYAVAPTVSSVSPNVGPLAGGTAVTITGTNFSSPAAVTFGSSAATNVVVVSSTSITANAPAGSAGSVSVTVTSNGQSGTLNNAFTYAPALTVTNTSPNVGPLSGGTVVTITGTNFVSPATVMFGATAATNVTVASSTSITATTPAGSAGSVNVTVTSNGQSGTLTNGFTYSASPTVSSVSPGVGPLAGGTAVTITGTNFVSPATVTFGSAAATKVTVVSTTSITATTPPGSAGSVNVTVTSNGQSGTLANGFIYAAAPTVSSVSPSVGSTLGGTSVTITGTNFASPATVMFGTNAATNVAVVSSTSITATTPARSAGAVTVAVTSNGQTGKLTSGFTYAIQPTVTSISPTTGSVAGSTAVTIKGTGFAAGATVTFGGNAATSVTVVNSTSIKATSPAHAAGSVTVTVTNSSGLSASLTNGFTYTSGVAINFGQVAAATPQTPTQVVPVTFPGVQTAGDLNVVVVGWDDLTSTVQSVTDSAGNHYSLAIGPTKGTGLQQSIYYASSIVGGSNTVTVTFNQAAAFPDIRILEYQGVSTLDVTAGASGSASPTTSGSATTTAANELIFGANYIATETQGPGTGFTTRIISVPDSDIAEDEVSTAVGSFSATAPLKYAGPWVMQMATFK